MSWEVWGPPLVVAAVGLIAGLILVLRSRGGPAGPVSLTREDLQVRKDALVEQLRGLQAEEAKLDADTYRARFDRTLDKAARALRDLEEFDAAPAAAPATAEPAAAGSGGTRRLMWAGLTVVFFVGLGLTLTQASKPRGEGGMTGATVDARQARIQDAQARLEADPTDLDAAAFLAHVAIRSGDLDAGMKYVDAGRRIDDDDPRIQSSLAALMISIGYFDRADMALTGVLAEHPDLPQAWLWSGVLRLTQGDRDGAAEAFQKTLDLTDDAEDRRLAASLLADAKAPPPEPRVTGRLELAEGASVPPGAIVFVFARGAAEAAGPPVAALRKSAAELPLDFVITDADVIMKGRPWPEEVWLQAKVDLDGNAATDDEGAPVAEPFGPITSADEAVTLTLVAPQG